jgi:hypothetical protein
MPLRMIHFNPIGPRCHLVGQHGIAPYYALKYARFVAGWETCVGTTKLFCKAMTPHFICFRVLRPELCCPYGAG